ncbi:hypothetical protein OG2516_04229 [Oceanicola granulosus HTCC2516]|uniref:Bacteriophage phiJL001 Gp84 C-terminal domain-containing protein n=1 Tax=Oceanicola granulosus (strain ATCC BAA-861 / DSM 15982 / KCTC 12143 / HTCC2516) TaxID=314256 RepID=Q2CEC3_OCEGH|nr:DUF2163 domain-containing protein [Oceanicola granulosus]EAR51074.1 hypothetical protein OG2516_04229 [Oceanicola granulosus HTCC2516]
MSLADHLATGITSVCRCWRVTRRDGVALGFTDHDRDLVFDGLTFRADTGLSARESVRSTGLAVDNSEALGILSDDAVSAAAVSAADIEAGSYDGAEVEAWLVNWRAPEERRVRFRGHIGELRRGGGAFVAELRGLTDALNAPVGRAYGPRCDALLGDAACGVDLEALAETAVAGAVADGRVLRCADTGRAEGWYEGGRLEVTSGAAAGLAGIVKHDRIEAGERVLVLWEPIRAPVVAGDALRLLPGCDKAAGTCREKFHNFMNFRGFPHIPGEDWLAAVPRRDGDNDGGAR